MTGFPSIKGDLIDEGKVTFVDSRGVAGLVTGRASGPLVLCTGKSAVVLTPSTARELAAELCEWADNQPIEDGAA